MNSHPVRSVKVPLVGAVRLRAQDRRYPGWAHEPLATVSQGYVNPALIMRDEIGASDLRPQARPPIDQRSVLHRPGSAACDLSRPPDAVVVRRQAAREMVLAITAGEFWS